MDTSSYEYSKKLQLDDFSYVLIERISMSMVRISPNLRHFESTGDFNIEVESKDKNLYVGLSLNEDQVLDIINIIENTLSNSQEPIEFTSIDHVELIKKDDKTSLDIQLGPTLISINFTAINDVKQFCSILKEAARKQNTSDHAQGNVVYKKKLDEVKYMEENKIVDHFFDQIKGGRLDEKNIIKPLETTEDKLEKNKERYCTGIHKNHACTGIHKKL